MGLDIDPVQIQRLATFDLQGDASLWWDSMGKFDLKHTKAKGLPFFSNQALRFKKSF